MNNELKKTIDGINNTINMIVVELERIKSQLNELVKPSLAHQIFDAAETEEVLDAKEQAEIKAWKKVHPEFQ